MAGPVSIQPPPGAREAQRRRDAYQARRLLKAGGWVTDSDPGRALADTQIQAHTRARTYTRLITTHTDLDTPQIRRRVWQVSSGPNAGRWRWALRLRTDS